MSAPYQLLDPLRPEEYEALKGDIAARGVLVPVEKDEVGNILDGHNRVQIAAELRIDYPQVVRSFDSEPEKVEHVLKLNLLRRHLGPIGWARAFERLAELRGIRLSQGARNTSATVAEVAAELGVPERTARRRVALARELASHPDLADQVDAGAISPSDARREIRHARITARDAALGPPPPLPHGPFDVILADPPWRPEQPGSDARRIENQYPTMALEEICALDVPAADDAALFLWAPIPMLPEALEVMSAWGFHYRTAFTWVKNSIGMGYWVRQRAELLLIGRRGKFGPPGEGCRPDSVIEAPRREHSRKPDEVYDLIERMFPRASKVELFARNDRPGWSAWGLEVPA